MDSFNHVIQTLEAMNTAHGQLLELANEKRNLLVDGNIQGLQNLIQLESKCADEIERLELQRQSEVQAFMTQSGLTGDSYTLEELINAVDDADRKIQLQSIAQELRCKIKTIAELNESNQQLIQTSLSFIQYSVGLLVKNEPAIGYGPKATKQYANLLDAKI
ncbi:flagellar protein FlgN [Neobacillus sp. OS1-32]|uniref:Flagellar protein FlgN n=1 Tax=Neobacillus paridis TaxID=2803862 RepID=A0ABS1TNT4_9BACI|nr:MULTISPECIES: flagellar protein FlgN [Neobacillus]MBL4952937.1 flagellar protein FlgN [Neobacillus paridis]WML31541.1 flagellar protein FlgN [Neobacillus sp. OS1-32]